VSSDGLLEALKLIAIWLTSHAIEWTDATWNPTTGCTKVSPGCAHCYIERTPAFRIAGRKFVQRRDRPAAAPEPARATAALAEAAAGVRQQPERSVPRRRAGQLHPRRVRA
jgi:protein gp37